MALRGERLSGRTVPGLFRAGRLKFKVLRQRGSCTVPAGCWDNGLGQKSRRRLTFEPQPRSLVGPACSPLPSLQRVLAKMGPHQPLLGLLLPASLEPQPRTATPGVCLVPAADPLRRPSGTPACLPARATPWGLAASFPPPAPAPTSISSLDPGPGPRLPPPPPRPAGPLLLTLHPQPTPPQLVREHGPRPPHSGRRDLGRLLVSFPAPFAWASLPPSWEHPDPPGKGPARCPTRSLLR